MAEYNDYTHLTETEMQNINLLAEAIRHKVYGIDVRESIALAIELMLDIFSKENNDAVAEITKARNEFGSLDERLDDMLADMQNISVSQINKNLGKLDSTYFSDEFLTELSGGTLNVTNVVDQAITTAKLADGAVTAQKTSFMESNTITYSKHEGYYVLGGTTTTVSVGPYAGYTVYLVDIDPSTTYTIGVEGRTTARILKSDQLYPFDGTTLTFTVNDFNDYALPKTITTDSNDSYFYIGVPNGSNPPSIQLGTEYEPLNYSIKPSYIANDAITPAKTTFFHKNEKYPLTLEKHAGYAISGALGSFNRISTNAEYTVYVANVSPNTTYTFDVESLTVARMLKSEQKATFSSTAFTFSTVDFNDYAVPYTFTTDSNDKYVYISIKSDQSVPIIQKGTVIIPDQLPYLLDNGYIDRTTSTETKKLSFLGDSITKGVGSSDNLTSYTSYVSEVLENYEIVKNGIAGTSISKHTDREDSFVERYTQLPADSDYIIVFGGVNDHQGWNITAENALGDMNSTSEYHFYGALKIIIEGLMTSYPSARIGFITPMKYNNYLNVNGNGATLNDYRNAIIEVCEYYSVPVLDLFTQSQIAPFEAPNATTYLSDGLHPNDLGYEMIGDKIAAFIKRI